MKWYVIRTQTGKEDDVVNEINSSLEKMPELKENIAEVYNPKISVIDEKDRITEKPYTPGMIFIKMNLNEYTYAFIRNTPYVKRFLEELPTGDKLPLIGSVPESEIEELKKKVLEQAKSKPKYEIELAVGNKVRITTGPLKHFVGVITEIPESKRTVKVQVYVFNQATTIELDHSHVERL